MRLHLYNDANEDLGTETMPALIPGQRCKCYSGPGCRRVGLPAQVRASTERPSWASTGVFFPLSLPHMQELPRLHSEGRLAVPPGRSSVHKNSQRLPARAEPCPKLCSPSECWATRNN